MSGVSTCQERPLGRLPLVPGGKAMPSGPAINQPCEMLMVNDWKQWPICGGGRVLCTPRGGGGEFLGV